MPSVAILGRRVPPGYQEGALTGMAPDPALPREHLVCGDHRVAVDAQMAGKVPGRRETMALLQPSLERGCTDAVGNLPVNGHAAVEIDSETRNCHVLDPIGLGHWSNIYQTGTQCK